MHTELPKIDSVMNALRGSLNIDKTQDSHEKSSRTVQVNSSLNPRPKHLTQHKVKPFRVETETTGLNVFNSTNRTSDLSIKTARVKGQIASRKSDLMFNTRYTRNSPASLSLD